LLVEKDDVLAGLIHLRAESGPEARTILAGHALFQERVNHIVTEDTEKDSRAKSFYRLSSLVPGVGTPGY
jgi:hypothetical protein